MVVSQNVAARIDYRARSGPLAGNYVQKEIMLDNRAGDVHYPGRKALVEVDIVLLFLGQSKGRGCTNQESHQKRQTAKSRRTHSPPSLPNGFHTSKIHLCIILPALLPVNPLNKPGRQQYRKNPPRHSVPGTQKSRGYRFYAVYG